MCPICRAAESRLLCHVPTTGHPGRSLLTVRVTTPPLHRCPDVDVNDGGAAGDAPSVMVFFGELDSHTSAVVGAGCLGWMPVTGDTVIDLSAVTLVDSSGSRLLERLRDEAPGVVRFRDPSRIVQHVFAAIGRPIDIE